MTRRTLHLPGLSAAALLLALTACDRPATRAIAPPDERTAGLPLLSPMQAIGKQLFFDTNLSLNHNQSCAACHDPAVGGTGPSEAVNIGGGVYEGSIAGAFGNRKPPASAYASHTPIFHHERKAGWVGGSFWDGRATGAILGSPLAEQAKGPFLNPKEQALPTAACLVYLVSVSSYVPLYKLVWGPDIGTIDFGTTSGLACPTAALSAADQAKVNTEFDHIAFSIAAWESSPDVNRYTSKFDAWKAGLTSLTKDEVKGWALFNGKGKCARCHAVHGTRPQFTDFTYDNVGVPTNPMNPATLADPSWRDPGLGGYLQAAGYPASVYGTEMGKFKVPTLRNVDLRPTPGYAKSYMHNGVFKSLEEVVHFYNTRDVLPRCAAVFLPILGANCWPAPEVSANLNTTELGNLGLSAAEEHALVAFLKALSDGWYSP